MRLVASWHSRYQRAILLFSPRSFSALYALVLLNCSLLVVVVWTVHYYDLIDIETVIQKRGRVRTKDKDTNRIRFTQMWSTGHVGTRFLANLLQGPEFLDENFEWKHSSDYIAWNEKELPYMKQTESHDGSKLIWVPFSDMSLHDFKALMFKAPEHLGWYSGTKIKRWNRKGDNDALRSYLKNERIPALRSVYQRYSNQFDHPEEKLNHFIKVGHTSIFFDLSDYYEILSSASIATGKTIDVDFVRIRRSRIEVANSFVSDKSRRGPVESEMITNAVVTHPNMKTALLRFKSIGGPLPDMVYWNWTLFQKYLWFCDEIEARWRVFLKKYPEVRYYELNFMTSKDNPHRQVLLPSSIDDLALNFLQIGFPLSSYTKETSHRSHITNDTKVLRMTREEMEEQAIEYSKQSPWCLQFEGSSTNTTQDYPKLDCGLLA